MNQGILLGYEVGTAKAVYVPEGHNLITGMTQLSGKTTGLEAMVDRGNVTAVTFITKRGEQGFKDQRFIEPYYQEQKRGRVIDWQWVESILVATMGEKMNLYRSFIIDACNGKANMKPAKSLDDVYQNFTIGKETSRRGFDTALFTNLEAYFEIVLPEIKKRKFASKLKLKKGFNVMNLVDMPNQMQQLVIRATLEYIYKNLKNTVVIIPEAHKFIPTSNTPVKPVALLLAREGATIGNYVWIDTQETTSVDKKMMKQVSNWIMGYQQEKNEVKNVREHLGNKVTAKQITSLKLGHFMTSLRQVIQHVYILPSGVSEQVGKNVALGKVTPEQVKAGLKKARSGEDEEMYRRKYEELQEEHDALLKKLEEAGDTSDLQIRINELETKLNEAQMVDDTSELQGSISELETQLKTALGKAKDFEAEAESEKGRADSITLQYTGMEKRLREQDAFVTAFQEFILNVVVPLIPDENFQPRIGEVEQPESVDLSVEQPILHVNVIRKIASLKLDTSKTVGQVYWLYSEGYFDEGIISVSGVRQMLIDNGWKYNPQLKSYLDKMVTYGYLTPVKRGGRGKGRVDYKVKLTSKEAKEKGLIKHSEKVV